MNVARNVAQVAIRTNESNMTSQKNAYVTVVDWIILGFNESSLNKIIACNGGESFICIIEDSLIDTEDPFWVTTGSG